MGLHRLVLSNLLPTILMVIIWFHLYISFCIKWFLPRFLIYTLSFLLRHQHHLCHVDLLIKQTRWCTKCAMCIYVVWRECVIDLSLVAAQSSVSSVRSLIVAVSSSRVSPCSPTCRQIIVSFAALAKFILEPEGHITRSQTLKMHIWYRFQVCPCGMMLLRASTRQSRVRLLRSYLIPIAEEANT